MMGLPFTACFVFLIVEIIMYVLLVIPWPKGMRRALLHLFTTSNIAQKFQTAQMFLLFMVAFLFADSLRKMYHEMDKHHKLEAHESGEAHHHLGDEIADQKIHSRLFFAQRNIYLTAFALFVAFAYWRLVATLKHLCLTEEKLEKIEGLIKDKEVKTVEDKKNK